MGTQIRLVGPMRCAGLLLLLSIVIVCTFLILLPTVNANPEYIPYQDASHVNRPTGKETIPVNMRIMPSHYLHETNYMSTGVNFTATAEILDEKFKNQSIIYQWSTKNMSIGTFTDQPVLQYKFDKADPDTFLKVLVVHRPNDTGVISKKIAVRDPVKISEPLDKLFIEQGELLNITLKFSGTGPFGYCYDFNEQSCDLKAHYTEENYVKIIHYLRRVGNYSLFFSVYNIASHQNKSLLVRVLETPHESTVPYVPIVCSVTAIFILLVGFALHLKFNSFSLSTETADFDFTRSFYNESVDEEELWDEEQSFMQRVKLLLFRSNRRNSSIVDSNDRSRVI